MPKNSKEIEVHNKRIEIKIASFFNNAKYIPNAPEIKLVNNNKIDESNIPVITLNLEED